MYGKTCEAKEKNEKRSRPIYSYFKFFFCPHIHTLNQTSNNSFFFLVFCINNNDDDDERQGNIYTHTPLLDYV